MHLFILLLSMAAMLQPALERKETTKASSKNEKNMEEGLTPELKKEIVDRHNEIRRNVMPTASNMLKMSWDETIAKTTQNVVKKCYTKTSLNKERTVNRILCGETLYHTNYAKTWSEVIQFWHKKSSNFKYGVGAINPKNDPGTFTQMIWYRSYRISCGFAYCPRTPSPFHYLCHYCPIGNVVEDMPRPYKQGKPCGDCPHSCDNKLCTNPCSYVDTAHRCEELKKTFSCKAPYFRAQCQASCSCEGKIK